MTPGGPLHVYGLVEKASRPIRGLKGRQGAPVGQIKLGKVAALVSTLDPSARLLRDDLLAHAHVLERVAEHESVLPMRFGVQAESENDLRHRIHADEWVGLLHRFDGLVQMTIDAAHHEDAALREVLHRDPELIALRDAGSDELGEQARKLELGERVAHALEALRAEDGAALLDRLTPLAREVVDQTEPGRLLLAAFLIERRKRHVFDKAVAAAQKGLPRVDIRYLGPQPPWAFLDESMKLEA